MQAAFDEIMGVDTHDDVDADMHDLFFLLSAAPETDGVSGPHAEALGSSTSPHGMSPQPDCNPEVFCLSEMIPLSGHCTGFRVKQEPMEVVGLVDVCESSRVCTSSSGGSSFANTAVSGGSPIHAPSPSFIGCNPEPYLGAVVQEQGPYSFHQVTSEDSAPVQAAAMPTQVLAATLAVAPAALSESKPDDLLAPTQSDSTDALYDIVQSKSSRSYGRSSGKKPPLSHSTIEKHRRDRINHLIEELGEMVPPIDPRFRCEGAESAGLKRPKHAVLADVVARYRQLQVENENLRRQLAMAGLQPGGSGPAASGSGSRNCHATAAQQPLGFQATNQPSSQPTSSPPAATQSTQGTTAPAVPVATPFAAAAAFPPADTSVTAVATSNTIATCASGSNFHVPALSGPAAQEVSCSNPAAAAAATAAALPTVIASLPTAPISSASGTSLCPAAAAVAAVNGGAAPTAAAAAAAVSSLLSHAAVGAPNAQLQAALNFPLIKAAAAVAAAAAAATPLPSFVPVASSGPNTAAPTADLCGIYNVAAAVAATASPNSGLQLPNMMMVSAPAAAPSATVAAPPASQPEVRKAIPCNSLAALVASPLIPGFGCLNDCTTARAAVQPSPHVSDVQASPAAVTAAATGAAMIRSASLSPESSSDGTDSNSTEVHVCRTNAAKSKPMSAPAVAATATSPSSSSLGAAPSRRPGLTSHQAQQNNPYVSQQPSTSQRPSSSIAPVAPRSAAIGSEASPSTSSSWLVRVVCPPRKDLLSAACTALSEAGVSLRSARVTAASGGRMALELEVCCEEGILPRGMQVGHIQCAIHAALQASAGSPPYEDNEEEQECGVDGNDDGAMAALPPLPLPAHGRSAPTIRFSGKKRQRL